VWDSVEAQSVEGVCAVAGASLAGFELPASLAVGAAAAAIYLISLARQRRLEFTLLDALIVVAIMAVTTSVAMPFLATASDRANSSVLLQNLATLRTQIELYKIEHGGSPPLLYEGTFPQLTHATDAGGTPGPRGADYPYGPCLPAGIPANPFTGISTVTATETFPPTAATDVGGWLYHEETGRIAPDREEYLSR